MLLHELSIGLTLAAVVFAAEKSRYETDVVVVGAGISGLIAARDLARAGHKVTVIDAMDRLGGRAHRSKVPIGTNVWWDEG